MAETALVDAKIKTGAELVQILDETALPVAAAFWYWDPDAEEWRLVIGSSFVDQAGPTEAYRRVQNTLRNVAPGLGISLREVTLVGRQDPLLEIARSVAPADGATIPRRVSRALVGGRFVEDAYVYRTG